MLLSCPFCSLEIGGGGTLGPSRERERRSGQGRFFPVMLSEQEAVVAVDDAMVPSICPLL